MAAWSSPALGHPTTYAPVRPQALEELLENSSCLTPFICLANGLYVARDGFATPQLADTRYGIVSGNSTKARDTKAPLSFLNQELGVFHRLGRQGCCATHTDISMVGLLKDCLSHAKGSAGRVCLVLQRSRTPGLGLRVLRARGGDNHDSAAGCMAFGKPEKSEKEDQALLDSDSVRLG